jgi:hypothetical protein
MDAQVNKIESWSFHLFAHFKDEVITRTIKVWVSEGRNSNVVG